MKIDQRIHERLKELVASSPQVKVTHHKHSSPDPSNDWEETDRYYSKREIDNERASQWGVSCLNILKIAFGSDSDHYSKFNENFSRFPIEQHVLQGLGILKAALEDYSKGFGFDWESVISGEIFQDFVELAKRALAEGNKDVAAVLACAALEDTLKRYARKQGLAVDDKEMTDVVAALKSQGLVSGAQKTLLDRMPKIRNYAMHANWGKITEPDVNSVIGFVEQFLITYF